MAVKTSYGSITMVDIGDLGELSVVPMSNQPSIVVYDPDTNTYIPNWSISNLVLTPTIYYAGTQLSSNTQGLSVSWYENSEQATPTLTYALTVSTNKLSSSDYITYIVVVEYIDSSSGVTLRAKGQISFSKVSNASQLENIEITGEAAFLTSYINNVATTQPTNILLTANKQHYSGSIYWYYKNSSNNWTYTSSGNTKTVYPSDSGFVNSGKIATYRATSASNSSGIGGANELYDIHTITKISDGEDGGTGKDGLSFILGNYTDQIPCYSDGTVAGSSDIVKDIPFSAYQGTNRVYCTAAVTGGTISGQITTSVSQQDSKIVVTYKKDKPLGGAEQGNINITLTGYPDSSHTTSSDILGTQSFVYTWVKNKQANAVVFQIFTPDGNVINNETNTITVSPKLTEGSNEVTINSNMIKWYVYSNGDYDEIETFTSTDPIYKDGINLIITPAGVSSYLSVKAAVTYTPTGMPSSNTYEAYQSVYDKSDLFQVEVISTLGDKLLNSEGVGIIYTKITKNGALYDGIVSTAVAASNSAAAFNTAVAKPGVIGTNPSYYCWYCASTPTSLTLYSKASNSSSWSSVKPSNDPHIVSYSWTGTHNAVSSAPTSASIYGWGNNKAILLNGNLVNRKTTFNVTASSLI